mgnify:CR=1 FL=1|tara:strand:+ start:1280 stop:1810 length:531 start_codon:yes stop_codon:yes gene_type:complete
MASIGEIREWVTLLLVVGGVLIAWRTYRASLRQQRLENSFKMLDIFESNLRDDDLEKWMEIFRGSSEGTRITPGNFYFGGSEFRFTDLFSEGPPDDGAVSRILDQLELICLEANAKTVELRVIYSHIGQVMRHVYGMIKDDPNSSFSFTCPNFLKVMKSEQKMFHMWSTRTIVHCE